MKKFTVSIIGCGSRGQNTYGKYMYECKDKFELVSLCDNNEKMLDIAKNKFNITDDNCFLNEEEFFKVKRSDCLVIATQDRDHVRMCIKALELGYDVLLEKPISPIKEELYSLLEAQKKYGGKVIVCHVLRYAPAYLKMKEIIDSGKIGKIVGIEWTEQVAYWHQIHSFVRGNWRNDCETSPMIMQKCCHDLDLIQYYCDSRCDTIYSTGSLAYFNKDNKPTGASSRCKDCKYNGTCVHSAEFTYIKRWKMLGCPQSWPFDVVDLTRPITEESLRHSYENNQYGRCVFDCDNNVVDYQNTEMIFENGIRVNLTMTGFTDYPGRKMTFHGTKGEIEMDEWRDFLRVSVYGEETEHYNIKEYETYSVKEIIHDSIKDAFGHGGGDQRLIDDFYKAISGDNSSNSTTLEKSIESHLMALTAEESRLINKVLKVHK